jgi:hypothetical protein
MNSHTFVKAFLQTPQEKDGKLEAGLGTKIKSCHIVSPF